MLGTSPLEDAHAEIARLHKELTRLKRLPATKNDLRLLDFQLQNRAMRKYIEQSGLLADFKAKNPSIN